MWNVLPNSTIVVFSVLDIHLAHFQIAHSSITYLTQNENAARIRITTCIKGSIEPQLNLLLCYRGFISSTSAIPIYSGLLQRKIAMLNSIPLFCCNFLTLKLHEAYSLLQQWGHSCNCNWRACYCSGHPSQPSVMYHSITGAILCYLLFYRENLIGMCMINGAVGFQSPA